MLIGGLQYNALNMVTLEVTKKKIPAKEHPMKTS